MDSQTYRQEQSQLPGFLTLRCVRKDCPALAAGVRASFSERRYVMPTATTTPGLDGLLQNVRGLREGGLEVFNLSERLRRALIEMEEMDANGVGIETPEGRQVLSRYASVAAALHEEIEKLSEVVKRY